MPDLPPIALRRAIDSQVLVSRCFYDSLIHLGSFWSNSPASFESRLIKGFKECNPTTDFEPHISKLCGFYAELAAHRLSKEKIDWVVRVLSSSETNPDRMRPQEMLSDRIASQIGAKFRSDVFFKTESRSSMRTVSRLNGPNALRPRIQYVLQDIFIHQTQLQGTVLLVDDIYTLGASMRVYSCALKTIAGTKRVIGLNLAATRFSSGKDGHGRLILDASGISRNPEFGLVWIDESNIYHTCKQCDAMTGRSFCELRFLAERKAAPCPSCAKSSERKWWHIWKI